MKIQYFHGLMGFDDNKKIEPDPTVKLLEKSFKCEIVGNNIYDYYGCWDVDRLRTLLTLHTHTCKNVDLFVGNSFGGYIAFILAQYFVKPVVMINPALNRNFSITGIDRADFEYRKRNIPIYTYLGYLDTTVNPLYTLTYLADQGFNDVKIQWKRSTHIVQQRELEKFFNWVNKDLKGVEMNGEEYLNWCKNRALEYLDRNEVRLAALSFLSDISKHPETKDIVLPVREIRFLTLMSKEDLEKLIKEVK